MIKLLEIRGARLEISVACVLALGVAVAAGAAQTLLLSFLALSLHELCHTLMAAALGYAVESIEIQPFGFTARLASRTLSLRDDALIALAGPVCSIIIGMCALTLENGELFMAQSGDSTAQRFGAINLILGAINLIPALPLDGGRLMSSMLSRVMAERTAARVCACVAFAVAGLLLCVFGYGANIGEVNLTLVIFAALIMLGAARELTLSRGARAERIVRRTTALLHGRCMEVRRIAVHRDTTVARAAGLVNAERVTEFSVLDDGMNVICVVPESRVLANCHKNGEITMGGLIDRTDIR